jgi:hypothetical protein
MYVCMHTCTYALTHVYIIHCTHVSMYLRTQVVCVRYVCNLGVDACPAETVFMLFFRLRYGFSFIDYRCTI